MPDQDSEDPFWDSVYAARAAYYREHFGELPDDILKIGHMFGVWPGGGLFVIPAARIGPDVWAFTTFGLSNPDMPATTTVSDVEVERDELGRTVSSSGTLQEKAPAAAPPGAAGYGYEMLLLARENAEWPIWFIHWAANVEILNDVGFLNRVERHSGLTIESIRVGEDESVNVLIAKAQPPLPTGTTLPNGRMDLLVATVITDDEMAWSMEHGREALLQRLQRAGIGQMSVRDRKSVLA